MKKSSSSSSTTITTGNNKDASATSSSSQQQTLTSLFGKLPKERENGVTKMIANYITKDMRPLDCVNDSGFIKLIKYLEPRYKLCGRMHVTETVIPAII